MPNETTFQVTITEHEPEKGILACADVKVGDLLVVRNVKIKQDDYGYVITMPRTKMPYTDQYKDSVFFTDKAMKEKFDQAVGKAYEEYLLENGLAEEPEEEPEPGMGMEPFPV